MALGCASDVLGLFLDICFHKQGGRFSYVSVPNTLYAHDRGERHRQPCVIAGC